MLSPKYPQLPDHQVLPPARVLNKTLEENRGSRNHGWRNRNGPEDHFIYWDQRLLLKLQDLSQCRWEGEKAHFWSKDPLPSQGQQTYQTIWRTQGLRLARTGAAASLLSLTLMGYNCNHPEFPALEAGSLSLRWSPSFVLIPVAGKEWVSSSFHYEAGSNKK